MTRYLESEAPESFKLALKHLEDQSDDWFSDLHIFKRPWDMGYWGVLTGIVEIIERAIRERGNASGDHKAALLNLGLIGPMLFSELQRHSLPATGERRDLNSQLAREATLAIDVAHKRQSFFYTFPIWHKNQYYAEFVGTNRIRFTARGGANERRVSAFHKGFRPAGFIFPPQDPQGLQPASETELMWLSETAHSAKSSGETSFFYPKNYLLIESFQRKYSDLLPRWPDMI